MSKNLSPVFNSIDRYEYWLRNGPYTWEDLRVILDELRQTKTRLRLSAEVASKLHCFSIIELDKLLANCRQEPYDVYFADTLIPDYSKLTEQQKPVLLRHFTAFELLAALSVAVEKLSITDQNRIKISVIAKKQAFIEKNHFHPIAGEERAMATRPDEDPTREQLIDYVREFIVSGPYTLEEVLNIRLRAKDCSRPFYINGVLDACLHKFPAEQLALVLRMLRVDDETDMPFPKFNAMDEAQVRAYSECVEPSVVHDFLITVLADSLNRNVGRFLLEAVAEANSLRTS